jgi:hypothetical protein
VLSSQASSSQVSSGISPIMKRQDPLSLHHRLIRGICPDCEMAQLEQKVKEIRVFAWKKRVYKAEELFDSKFNAAPLCMRH